jgi:hypothetical protein
MATTKIDDELFRALVVGEDGFKEGGRIFRTESAVRGVGEG